ncbi:MAG: SUMF1/EgtB/PvdO family nonheme iron enzyme, partial [Lacipirellulaceae bacterium]
MPFREAAEVTALKTAKSTAGKAMVPYLETIPGTEVSFEMLPIPAGKFTLGSPASEPGRSADEGPQVEINVEPFWMGKHEVTWGEYLE